jgi:ElaB/YqjD/DUF883 family membrane-anchored ribosome-binding protein
MIDRLDALKNMDVNQQVDALREAAADMTAVARERFEQGGKALKDFVMRDPIKALGLAVGLGLFLGWMVKRR